MPVASCLCASRCLADEDLRPGWQRIGYGVLEYAPRDFAFQSAGVEPVIYFLDYLLSAVNVAPGQRLSELCNTGIRDVGALKHQLLKLSQPLEVLQPAVRDFGGKQS